MGLAGGLSRAAPLVEDAELDALERRGSPAVLCLMLLELFVRGVKDAACCSCCGV
jgi:hypothetical protein